MLDITTHHPPALHHGVTGPVPLPQPSTAGSAPWVPGHPWDPGTFWLTSIKTHT